MELEGCILYDAATLPRRVADALYLQWQLLCSICAVPAGVYDIGTKRQADWELLGSRIGAGTLALTPSNVPKIEIVGIDALLGNFFAEPLVERLVSGFERAMMDYRKQGPMWYNWGPYRTPKLLSQAQLLDVAMSGEAGLYLGDSLVRALYAENRYFQESPLPEEIRKSVREAHKRRPPHEFSMDAIFGQCLSLEEGAEVSLLFQKIKVGAIALNADTVGILENVGLRNSLLRFGDDAWADALLPHLEKHLADYKEGKFIPGSVTGLIRIGPPTEEGDATEDAIPWALQLPDDPFLR